MSTSVKDEVSPQDQESSVDFLYNGYVDYGSTVVQERALTSVFDGLKLGQRRALLCMIDPAYKKWVSTLALVGDTTKVHHHGDAAIAGTVARMTDVNGTMNYPLIAGNGNFGRQIFSGEGAAPRYTSLKQHPNFVEMFSEGFLGIPTGFDDNGDQEYLHFPTKLPVSLLLSSTGLGVGLSTRIPSFNFWDVLRLTRQYVQNGEIAKNDIIYPDFSTGGVLLRDANAGSSLMHKGSAKFTVRAKVEVIGREIHILEVPFGHTVDAIIESVQNLIVDGAPIRSVIKKAGLRDKVLAVVDCRSKAVVDEVLNTLYGKGILQVGYSPRMVFLDYTSSGEQVVFFGGVHRVIGRWVQLRRELIVRRAKLKMPQVQYELTQYAALLALIADKAATTEFLKTLSTSGKEAGIAFLKDFFSGTEFASVDEGILEWITSRRAVVFHDGGRFVTMHESLQKQYQDLLAAIENPDDVILGDLEELEHSHAGQHERLTQLTNTQYLYSARTLEEAQDNSEVFFTFTQDGYVKKTRAEVDTSSWLSTPLCSLKAGSSDVLFAFDNYGTVYRVYGAELGVTDKDKNSMGSYLFSQSSGEVEELRKGKSSHVPLDQYGNPVPRRLVFAGLLESSTFTVQEVLYLLFRDGFASKVVVDSLRSKKKWKVSRAVLNNRVGKYLFDVVPASELPEFYAVHDDVVYGRSRTLKSRVGVFSTQDWDSCLKDTLGTASRVFKAAGSQYDVNFVYACDASLIPVPEGSVGESVLAARLFDAYSLVQEDDGSVVVQDMDVPVKQFEGISRYVSGSDVLNKSFLAMGAKDLGFISDDSVVIPKRWSSGYSEEYFNQ